MPKVSVIVPIYNVSKYLPTCLNSLVTQSLKDIEIICIEDKSTDNSREILKEYEKNYPYLIKAVYLEENQGLSHARNTGLSLANGKYIGFVDSDDLVSHTMYEDFSKTLEFYNMPLLVGNCFQIREDAYLSKEVFPRCQKKRPYISDYLKHPDAFFEETPAVWDKLFLHDFIQYDCFLEGAIYEDAAFTYPILLRAQKTVQLLQSDYAYRQNSQGIMATSLLSKNTRILDMLRVYDKSIEMKLPEEEKKMLKDRMKQYLYSTIHSISFWDIPLKEKEDIMAMYLRLANYRIANLFSYDTLYAQKHFTDIQNHLEEKILYKKPITSVNEAINTEQKLIRKLKR